MSKHQPTYDVFLSYSMTDAEYAQLAERALSEAGLSVFNAANVPTGVDIQAALWEALAESAALVVVVSAPSAPGATTAVEVGAAMAWHKQVYVITTERQQARSPGYLSQFRRYHISRVRDMALAIQRGLEPLSGEEVLDLCDIYAKLRIPTDRLLREPRYVDKLGREFAKRSGRNIPPERLVRELIRLRKTGKLPRLRKAY